MDGNVTSDPAINLPPVDPIFLTWEGLTVIAKKTKRLLLDDVTGIAQPGQLIALMGARFFFFCSKILYFEMIIKNLENVKVEIKKEITKF